MQPVLVFYRPEVELDPKTYTGIPDDVTPNGLVIAEAQTDETRGYTFFSWFLGAPAEKVTIYPSTKPDRSDLVYTWMAGGEELSVILQPPYPTPPRPPYTTALLYRAVKKGEIPDNIRPLLGELAASELRRGNQEDLYAYAQKPTTTIRLVWYPSATGEPDRYDLVIHPLDEEGNLRFWLDELH